MFLCFLFELDFAYELWNAATFHSWFNLPQLFLLKSRLEVSSGKTKHVGKLEITWTWIRSYWSSQIH